MELDELLLLTTQENYSSLKSKLSSLKPTKDLQKYLKQYDPSKHDVTDTTKRPDKDIETDKGPSRVPVNRLAVPMQKKIVNMAAAFLCANPIDLVANPTDQVQIDLVSLVNKTWSNNKLHYDTKDIAKKLMSETEAAELWYFEEVEPGYWANTPNDKPNVKFRLRMKVLAPSLGDTLLPVFNSNGDMIAFGRIYMIKIDNRQVEHFDLYTADKTFLGEKSDSGYTVKEEANLSKKIPIIYYSQAVPEWNDVQVLIDRFETLISNHGDSNDYFGSPVIFVQGEIEGFAKKGEQGKVLVGKKGAKAEYLTWDQAPESIKLEYSNLRSLMYDLSDTPDISMEQLKNVGTFSGIALKMIFLGAHLKAADKEEGFGKSIQRRINFIKAALAVINVAMEKGTGVEISPKFTYFIPNNDKELMDLLTEGVQAGILSKQTGIEHNPVVYDPALETERINTELKDPSNIGGGN